MPRFRYEPQACVEISEAAIVDSALSRAATFRVYCLGIASEESISVDVMARVLGLSRGAVVSALNNLGTLGWAMKLNREHPPPPVPRYLWLDLPLDVDDSGTPLQTDYNMAVYDYSMWLINEAPRTEAERRSRFRVIRNNEEDL